MLPPMNLTYVQIYRNFIHKNETYYLHQLFKRDVLFQSNFQLRVRLISCIRKIIFFWIFKLKPVTWNNLNIVNIKSAYVIVIVLKVEFASDTTTKYLTYMLIWYFFKIYRKYFCTFMLRKIISIISLLLYFYSSLSN